MKPVASSEALHPHLVQLGPSCGLYPSPPGRRRGREAGPGGKRRVNVGEHYFEVDATQRRAGPNPRVDYRRPR